MVIIIPNTARKTPRQQDPFKHTLTSVCGVSIHLSFHPSQLRTVTIFPTMPKHRLPHTYCSELMQTLLYVANPVRSYITWSPCNLLPLVQYHEEPHKKTGAPKTHTLLNAGTQNKLRQLFSFFPPMVTSCQPTSPHHSIGSYPIRWWALL